MQAVKADIVQARAPEAGRRNVKIDLDARTALRLRTIKLLTGRLMSDVVEEALAEYFTRHYPTSAGTRPA